MKRLIIIGAGGHGKVIADIALLSGYDQVDFLDDNPDIIKDGQYTVLGGRIMAPQFATLGCDFFVGVGNATIREQIHHELADVGCNIVTLIHPSAAVAPEVHIGKGTVVMADAIINAGTVVGDGCIINTCSSVDYNNEIGDYSHVSVSSHTAGAVSLGARCWLGIGAKVSNNVSICQNCMIGAGALVVNDITESGTYVGVPAKRIKV